MTAIASALQRIRKRMADATERCGRDPASVKLVAVSKTRSAAEVREAIAAGAMALGENYVQELLRKREQVGDEVEWHFIGHLQRNKSRYLAPFCALIHSVDSHRLAAEIDRRAAQHDRRQPCLIEVKLSDEQTKFGISDEAIGDLARQMLDLPHVELRGLMVMPPYSDDPEASRPYFVRLRALQEELMRNGIPDDNCRELSMGMTQDFEVALEEGATILRVGTAIFGPRESAGP
jgi:pyridoxal phosphate enzyme (YggS family)